MEAALTINDSTLIKYQNGKVVYVADDKTYVDFSNEEKIIDTTCCKDDQLTVSNYDENGIIKDYSVFKSNNVYVFRYTNIKVDLKNSKKWEDGKEQNVSEEDFNNFVKPIEWELIQKGNGLMLLKSSFQKYSRFTSK
ncbi:MAG: hypothetical protein J6M05_05575 [Cardiobacteriaceae bacterium]|nr:hypothetical protein [Cardiobacteriaceae bacterium]